MNFKQVFIIVLTTTLVFNVGLVSAEKRECKDLVSIEKYDSEGHKDNPQSKKGFEQSLKQDSLCKFTEKHDKEQISGEITNWNKLKNSEPYKTADKEQKECLKEGFDSPDDGHKAIQGYEIEYCGYDED